VAQAGTRERAAQSRWRSRLAVTIRVFRSSTYLFFFVASLWLYIYSTGSRLMFSFISYVHTLIVKQSALRIPHSCCTWQCVRMQGVKRDISSARATFRLKKHHAAPNNTDKPEIPSASAKGVLSLLRDGGAAAVVCSAGADLVALAEALPEADKLAKVPVVIGVSP